MDASDRRRSHNHAGRHPSSTKPETRELRFLDQNSENAQNYATSLLAFGCSERRPAVSLDWAFQPEPNVNSLKHKIAGAYGSPGEDARPRQEAKIVGTQIERAIATTSHSKTIIQAPTIATNMPADDRRGSDDWHRNIRDEQKRSSGCPEVVIAEAELSPDPFGSELDRTIATYQRITTPAPVSAHSRLRQLVALFSSSRRNYSSPFSQTGQEKGRSLCLHDGPLHSRSAFRTTVRSCRPTTERSEGGEPAARPLCRAKRDPCRKARVRGAHFHATEETRFFSSAVEQWQRLT